MFEDDNLFNAPQPTFLLPVTQDQAVAYRGGGQP